MTLTLVCSGLCSSMILRYFELFWQRYLIFWIYCDLFCHSPNCKIAHVRSTCMFYFVWAGVHCNSRDFEVVAYTILMGITLQLLSSTGQAPVWVQPAAWTRLHSQYLRHDSEHMRTANTQIIELVITDLKLPLTLKKYEESSFAAVCV